MESALLPYKSVSNVDSHSGHTCDYSLAKVIEAIALKKQVMFGRFNSTTIAQRTVFDIFRIEMGI